MAEAVRAGIEKAANLREQAVENTWRAVQTGVDTASSGFQRAADQFANTLGFSGEEGTRLARRSSQNMEAIMRCGTVLTQVFQDVSREWYGLAEKQWQRTVAGMGTLAHCRSMQDFAAVQSDLAREGLQQMVDDSRRIAERSLRAIDEASKIIAGAAHDNAGRAPLEKRA